METGPCLTQSIVETGEGSFAIGTTASKEVYSDVYDEDETGIYVTICKPAHVVVTVFVVGTPNKRL